MPLLLIAGVAFAILWAWNNTKVIPTTSGTPTNNPTTLPSPAVNTQRSIHIGGKIFSPYNLSPNNVQVAVKAAQLANIGAAVGVGIAASTSAAGAGSAAGAIAATPIPIIGAAIAVIGGIISIIAAHHAEAIKREADALNHAVPHFRDGLVQLIGAALRDEIPDDKTFKGYLQSLIDDYYTQTSKIRKGKWPANIDKQPDPCNGACVVGHWWIEKDSVQLYDLVSKIHLTHGKISLPAIPNHAGFQGSPSIDITF